HELLAASLDRTPLARLGNVHRGARRLAGPRAARAATLFLERGLEPREIHRHAPLARDDLRQIDRKTEGVVELEGVFTRNGLHPGHEDLLQPPEPAFDGF